MRVRVTLGVPDAYVDQVDLTQVRAVFPYGTVFPTVRPGGLLCHAGISLPDRGDRDGDDTIIVANAVVEVGY